MFLSLQPQGLLVSALIPLWPVRHRSKWKAPPNLTLYCMLPGTTWFWPFFFYNLGSVGFGLSLLR